MSSPQDPYSSPGVPSPVSVLPYSEHVVPTSRLAIASLVLGIIAVLACFIPVIPGLIAALLGFLAIQRTGPMKLAGRGLAVAGLVLGCCAVFMSILSLSIWLPALSHGREAANRVKCAEHMRRLGQQMRLYAVERRGEFPEDLVDLFFTEDVAREDLICPSTSHGAKPEGQLLLGDDVSYIYVGRGLTDGAPASAVLLYEPVEHHRRDGANFLFADGSVRFIPRTQARAMIQQLEKGINPPDPNAIAPPEPAGQR